MIGNKIVQCVPNFSEGRNSEKIEMIIDTLRGRNGVKLLDYSSDKDHNRTVVTLVGEPSALKEAILAFMAVAVENIDLREHKGQHPRMGAVDVVPFIPIKNVTMDEAILLSREVAEEASARFNLPIFLYEKSAVFPSRENLAVIRKGEFEGMEDKLKLEEWKPDFGPAAPHKTAGVTAIGARMPLVAFNVNLDTPNLQIADAIAKKVRHVGGGLRFCKAMGVTLEERNITQVSMNMTDYTKTALYRSFELIKIEARRYGVSVVGSEIVGMLPMQALIDCAEYYLGIENFSSDQILENKLME